jgi:hypothetical protein
MEEEGDHILGKTFMERFGSGTGRSQSSPAATICGEIERERRDEERKERKKKEPGRTGIGGRTAASLVPYCVQKVPARLELFLSTWRDTLL